MSRLIKSRGYLMKSLVFVLTFGLISLGTIGGCNDGSMMSFVDVHRTGQTTSHAPGDDGDFQSGVAPPEQRFTDNGDGTITDNLTGFIWTKDTACFEDAPWEETIEGAANVGEGDCGLTDGSQPGDWKVANLRELQTLLHYENSPLLPDDHPFTGVTSESTMWSSNTNPSDSDMAYFVDFGNGEVLLQPKTDTAGCALILILTVVAITTAECPGQLTGGPCPN